jgi:hypothetical protein
MQIENIIFNLHGYIYYYLQSSIAAFSFLFAHLSIAQFASKKKKPATIAAGFVLFVTDIGFKPITS